MFHYKPSILGYPHFRPPSILAKNHQTLIVLGVINPLSITKAPPFTHALSPWLHGPHPPRGSPRCAEASPWASPATTRRSRPRSAADGCRVLWRSSGRCNGTPWSDHAMGPWGAGPYAGHRGRVNCLVIVSIPIGSMVLLYMVTWIPSIYPQC